MPTRQDRFWKEVSSIIEEHSLLRHEFYQAWRKGALSVEDLRHYAAQYYPHVAAFPRYVSAVHSNVEDLKTRQTLLENLIEEERGTENHPELWLRFAEGLGMSRADVLGAEPSFETRECVETFMSMARDADPLAGLAALYAYEAQIPAVSRTKLQGLRDFYGIADGRARAFFEVHETADAWHSRQEREAIDGLMRAEEDRRLVKRSVAASCRAVWKLLDGVVEARGIACARAGGGSAAGAAEEGALPSRLETPGGDMRQAPRERSYS